MRRQGGGEEALLIQGEQLQPAGRQGRRVSEKEGTQITWPNHTGLTIMTPGR